MAARLGFEPRYTAPEAVVLPLDDLAAMDTISIDSSFITERTLIVCLHTIRRSGNILYEVQNALFGALLPYHNFYWCSTGEEIEYGTFTLVEFLTHPFMCPLVTNI